MRQVPPNSVMRVVLHQPAVDQVPQFEHGQVHGLVDSWRQQAVQIFQVVGRDLGKSVVLHVEVAVKVGQLAPNTSGVRRRLQRSVLRVAAVVLAAAVRHEPNREEDHMGQKVHLHPEHEPASVHGVSHKRGVNGTVEFLVRLLHGFGFFRNCVDRLSQIVEDTDQSWSKVPDFSPPRIVVGDEVSGFGVVGASEKPVMMLSVVLPEKPRGDAAEAAVEPSGHVF